MLVMSPASFLWMAELNAEVSCRIGWLRGGGGRLTVVEVGEVGGRASLLLMASSRLRTCVLGVRQIEQFCRVHRDVLVQTLEGSWLGVSISVLTLRSSAGSIFFVSVWLV